MGLLDTIALGILLVTVIEARELLATHRVMQTAATALRLHILANPRAVAQQICAASVRSAVCRWNLRIRVDDDNDSGADLDTESSQNYTDICDHLEPSTFYPRRYYLLESECIRPFSFLPLQVRSVLFELKSS